MTADNTSRGNSARMAARPVVDGGTSADTWTAWKHRFAPLDTASCPALVIVAPHPDDETLGLGATTAMLCAAGISVQVVSVSDGGAAYPGLGPADRVELEALRRIELQSATVFLGADEPIHLQFPDGQLDLHEGRLTDLLIDVLSGCPAGTWCAATWRGDGHPDHEAVGRAAAGAAYATGAPFIEYPVWMWHWARPGDSAVPWDRGRRVTLTDDALEMKQRAVQCFASQIQPTGHGYPVLPPSVVRRSLVVGEVVFV